ncbi:DNA-binding response regulator, NarL/FixJ family, contains REC and HTH domains [Tenacibaculum sp. MAR_2009_124]|uniref:response regulator n=1 Tax=Tenacibaculum sp. MAR_2009_124 TaxID=1250059 RepID=UPI000894A9CC|nr:response regulator [Tenacibaculum sp. MAR_2009_124]SEB42920.1 DNA-binding response regulator, NarL/FixJ family, contains REC and HTH domains [Tenacibaculum sp. MAR_2009_124]
MDNRQLTALIIDDHPLISEAYKSAFKFLESQNNPYSFDIHVKHNCDDAQQIIHHYAETKQNIDIIFLDMRLPPSSDGKILSGEDLGLKINQVLPESKIIVSTTFNDNYRVHNIIRRINPDGFLVKNDITPKELVTAIEEVLTTPPYYSKTVMKMIRTQVSNEYILDDIDRKILYELSIGNRMKKLPEVIPLSFAGIQKRKRHLAKIFEVDSNDDRELILVARDKGFL